MKLNRFFSLFWTRRGMIAVGVILIILAFIADWLRIGNSAKFGRNQFILLGVGILMFVFGCLVQPKELRNPKSLGLRIIALYRGAALLLFNTIVLLLILETFALIINWGLNKANAPDTPSVSRPIRDWEERYWPELSASTGTQYYPYSTWRHRSYQGETIQVGENGIRLTPGADCAENAYRVFAFGGSTMWGLGSPDWGTIPAYLQAGLEARFDQPICVINFGQDAFVASQELIELTLQLQQGNIPDLVIFYDGCNDIVAALYEKFSPNPHLMQSDVELELEHPILSLTLHSNIYKLINRFSPTLQAHSNIHEKTKQVIQTFYGNYEIVSALAETYQFDYAFFLQPVVILGNKPLTPFEQSLLSDDRPELYALFREVYDSIEEENTFSYFHSLSSIFDTTEEQIYLDFVHVFPEGNEIVAQEMLSILFENLSAETIR